MRVKEPTNRKMRMGEDEYGETGMGMGENGEAQVSPVVSIIITKY